jgi:hypothetical protein
MHAMGAVMTASTIGYVTVARVRVKLKSAMFLIVELTGSIAITLQKQGAGADRFI